MAKKGKKKDLFQYIFASTKAKVLSGKPPSVHHTPALQTKDGRYKDKTGRVTF